MNQGKENRFIASLPNPDWLWVTGQSYFDFSVKMVADIVGQSPRQIRQWALTGYIPSLPFQPVGQQGAAVIRLSANSIKVAWLISYGLDHGLSLRKSAEIVKRTYPGLWKGEYPVFSSIDAVPVAAPTPPIPESPDSVRAVMNTVKELSKELLLVNHRLTKVFNAMAKYGAEQIECDPGDMLSIPGSQFDTVDEDEFI